MIGISFLAYVGVLTPILFSTSRSMGSQPTIREQRIRDQNKKSFGLNIFGVFFGVSSFLGIFIATFGFRVRKSLNIGKIGQRILSLLLAIQLVLTLIFIAISVFMMELHESGSSSIIDTICEREKCSCQGLEISQLYVRKFVFYFNNQKFCLILFNFET